MLDYGEPHVRIQTTDFPQYFALVSRVRQDIGSIGPEGGVLSSVDTPMVQAVLPSESVKRNAKIRLQVF